MIDVLIEAFLNVMKEVGGFIKGLEKSAYIFLTIVGVALFYQLQANGTISQNYFSNKLDVPVKTEIVKTFYKVNHVIDGDTIELDMNGRKEKIRFIGINTPETVDPRKSVECFGKEASDKMKELAEGELVYLEYDNTQDMRDKYDRLLAYVYLQDDQMLNRKMIAEGYAYEYTYGTPYKYQKEFRELQNFARTQGRGLWAVDSCNGNK